jgi:hypothetical protein
MHYLAQIGTFELFVEMVNRCSGIRASTDIPLLISTNVRFCNTCESHNFIRSL